MSPGLPDPTTIWSLFQPPGHPLSLRSQKRVASVDSIDGTTVLGATI